MLSSIDIKERITTMKLSKIRLTLIALVAMLLLSTTQAFAARGRIQSLFPPGNDGSQPGAGLINPRNASGGLTAPPYHVFQTPSDVVSGQVLFEGLDVTYTQGTGNQATSIQRDVL